MGVDPVDVGDKGRVADAFDEWLRTRSGTARVERPIRRPAGLFERRWHELVGPADGRS